MQIPLINEHLFCKYFVRLSVGNATKALLLMDVFILVLLAKLLFKPRVNPYIRPTVRRINADATSAHLRIVGEAMVLILNLG